MKPLVPVGRARKVALGVGFFVVFVALWSVATLGGFVSKTFLADPITMLREGYLLFAQHGFAKDVGMTVWRVVGGFVLAAVVGVPLGIAMGAFKPIEAFFEPFVSFARYLPASAFIPLLILWAGIGEAQKLLVIFIGVFFQIVLMVAVIVGSTRRSAPPRSRRSTPSRARAAVSPRSEVPRSVAGHGARCRANSRRACTRLRPGRGACCRR